MRTTRAGRADVRAAAAKLHGRSPAELAEVLRRRLWSDLDSVGLRRDLRGDLPVPPARVPVTVRPLHTGDLDQLLADQPRSDETDRRHREARLRLHRVGLRTGYVAVTADGEPCFVEWLLGPEENERLRVHFSGIFPPLRPGEMLLEGAYTPPRFRGRRVMASAMVQLARVARARGARSLLTFVDADNVPSLRGCRGAGFHPYVRRSQRWRLLRHRVDFAALPAPAGRPGGSGKPHPELSR